MPNPAGGRPGQGYPQSDVVPGPSYDASHSQPIAAQHVSHHPAQYASQQPQYARPNHSPSQYPQPMMPPPPQVGPHHFAQPQAQPQAQPSFPSHFAPPTRGLPSTQRSSVMPAPERSSRRPSAFPGADERFAPDVTLPPPSLVAACVFLGGPLFLATMLIAVLALR